MRVSVLDAKCFNEMVSRAMNQRASRTARRDHYGQHLHA